MSIRDEFESWFKTTGKYLFLNDYLQQPLLHLDGDYVHREVQGDFEVWQAATKSKQSEIDELRRRISDLIRACADHVTARVDYKNRIDELDGAIREFLKEDDELIIGCADIEKLRNLLEKSK